MHDVSTTNLLPSTNGLALSNGHADEPPDELLAEQAAEYAAQPPDGPDAPDAVSLPVSSRAKKKKDKKSPSVASALVAAALKSGVTLSHTPDDKAIARIPFEDHSENYPLRGQRFRSYLSRGYYLTTKKTPGSQAIADALGVLEGMALHDGPEKRTDIRIAGHGDKIYLDLGNATWQAIEIDAAGWRLVTDPPVQFRRPKGVMPLPMPIKGGSLLELRPLVNVRGLDEWLLLAGWLAAAMRPTGPYPVLVLAGEQGSAKTTLGRFIRRIIDPAVAPLRSEPRDARDLMIAASNGWVIAYDNLSFIESWFSDALCRLSTGGGFGTRMLYTDEEEVLFDSTRPVILTSIVDVVTAGDLLDRSASLRLLSIPENGRLTEEELEVRFLPIWPRILGGLLDAVSLGLRLRPKIRPARLPRMADFALFAEAVCQGLGHPAGAFLDALERNRQDTDAVALDSYIIAPSLLQLMDEHQVVVGTASQLLDHLNRLAPEEARRQKIWPKRPHVLSNQLRKMAPNLRRAGIEVAFDRDDTPQRNRTIALTRQEKVSDEASRASRSVQSKENSSEVWTLPDAPASSPASSPASRSVHKNLDSDAVRTLPDALDAVSHTHSSDEPVIATPWDGTPNKELFR